MVLPLESVTVVSLEQAVAAPFATRHLADVGARVIKIERPGVGDFARHYDESVHGQSSYFVWLNRGKESLTLDISTDEGHGILLELVERADVFVQNLAPGAAERAGLGEAQLREHNDRLIYCTISGYGTTGEWGGRKAYDLLVQNEVGLVSVTGTEDTPAKVGVSVADIAAGMYAYSGILCALLERATAGVARAVRVSLVDALGEWMAQPFNYARYGGKPPRRVAAEHATIAPYGPYQTVDGTVVIAIQNEREWLAFCTGVLRQPGLATDPRFSTNWSRVRHRDDLNAAIANVVSTLSTAEALAALDAARIANARQNDVAALAHHPALVSRERWHEVVTPGGPITALLPPVDLDGLVPRMGAVPALGEHTRPLMRELGRSDAEIDQLITGGVV